MITFIFGTILYLALVLVVWVLASEDDIDKKIEEMITQGKVETEEKLNKLDK